MTIIVRTAPSQILSLEMVKQHLRVDHADDDTLISGLAASAQAHLSGPASWLGRSIGEQTLELVTSCRATRITLPYPPYIDLVGADYIDVDGNEQPIDINSLTVVPGLCRSAVVWPTVGEWPHAADRLDALRIRYRTGYAAGDPEFAPIRAAMLMLVGHWYANREATGEPQSTATLPFAVEALLSPLRVWSL